MKIAVISDLHDNITSWQLILDELKRRDIRVLLNCGDTCAPATLLHLSKTFSGDMYTVFGNVADKMLEAEKVKDIPRIHHFGEQAEFTLENKKIFLSHYPKISRVAAGTGMFDLACYGHDHTKHAERVDQTLLLNPGTAGGLFQYPSFAIVDLDTMKHEFIDITLP